MSQTTAPLIRSMNETSPWSTCCEGLLNNGSTWVRICCDSYFLASQSGVRDETRTRSWGLRAFYSYELKAVTVCVKKKVKSTYLRLKLWFSYSWFVLFFLLPYVFLNTRFPDLRFDCFAVNLIKFSIRYWRQWSVILKNACQGVAVFLCAFLHLNFWCRDSLFKREMYNHE